MFDSYGEIFSDLDGEEGLYYRGTRHLSHSELTIAAQRPLLLNSSITHDNVLLTIDLTNPDFIDLSGRPIPRGTVHCFKSIFLHKNTCYERIRFRKFHQDPLMLDLSFNFFSDFKDVFEVRGYRREKRGMIKESERKSSELILSYLGLDEVERRTRINFSSDCAEISGAGKEIVCEVRLNGSCGEVHLSFECESSENLKNHFNGSLKDRFDHYLSLRQKEVQAFQGAEVSASEDKFNSWIRRSHADLRMMITATPFGLYPYAGVPWFSTAFGRDGIITALQTLWLNPEIAKGVLNFLSQTQATEFSAECDAQPGKILHEFRDGEMANLKEIPFARYYGSVDSTPLFVVLASEYLKNTGDLVFIESIWTHIRAALDWIDNYGDADQDGFVEYARQSQTGLISQGWKDSHDSIFHADGSDAHAPVALCEVQGYAYQAKLGASFIAQKLGDLFLADRLRQQAEKLKIQFNEAFWCDEIKTFAIALDGKKKQCRISSSNVGHCLYSGIVAEDHAEAAARALMDPSLFCGWGLRTIGRDEVRYNPMSYHNGSVWPHDNSIAAMGLARYGFRDFARQLLSSMFETSCAMERFRLPELFCGFDRNRNHEPTLYPVSCAPQAWAAGAVFLMIQASLGLTMDAENKQIIFNNPLLPKSVGSLQLTGLRLGEWGVADIEIIRYQNDIALHVLRREGNFKIATLK